MKRKSFKIVSLFLVMFTLISAFPAITAQASKSGKCGDNITWTLDDYGILHIDGTGKMYDYTHLNPAPWSEENIFHIYLSYGIENIGNYAFYGLFVKYIDVGPTIKTIGNSAFEWCEHLYRVNINGDLETIGDFAFKGCTILEFTNIPDSVKKIGKDAYTYTKIYNDKSNWINDVLYINNHLIAAEIQNDKTYPIKRGTVTIADFAFDGCIDLKNVYFPYSVKNIGRYAFNDCLSYKGGVVPESVTDIGEGAFGFQDYGREDAGYYGFDMYCYENSAAHKFAKAHGFNINLVDDNVAVLTFYGLKVVGKYTYGISKGIDYYNFIALIDAKEYVEIKTIDYNEWDVYVDHGEIIKTGNVIIQDGKHISVAIVSGEVDGDGKIDATDYILVKSHFLKIKTLTDEMFAAADTNVDGKIDTTDYINIKRNILHID